MQLKVPIEAGATAEAWLSSLSLGSAARIAANLFIKKGDVCSQLKKLPAATKRALALPTECEKKHAHATENQRLRALVDHRCCCCWHLAVASTDVRSEFVMTLHCIVWCGVVWCGLIQRSCEAAAPVHV